MVQVEDISKGVEMIKMGNPVMTVDLTRLGERAEDRVRVNAEMNVEAAQLFCQVLRARTAEIIQNMGETPKRSEKEYMGGIDYDNEDLWRLARRWGAFRTRWRRCLSR